MHSRFDIAGPFFFDSASIQSIGWNRSMAVRIYLCNIFRNSTKVISLHKCSVTDTDRQTEIESHSHMAQNIVERNENGSFAKKSQLLNWSTYLTSNYRWIITLKRRKLLRWFVFYPLSPPNWIPADFRHVQCMTNHFNDVQNWAIILSGKKKKAQKKAEIL